MRVTQKSNSTDSLVPNGNFAQGPAYWEDDPQARYNYMRHIEFFADFEGDSSIQRGEPKYGLYSANTVHCRLNRNDLFQYPIRRFRGGHIASPVNENTVFIPKQRADDFYTENIDWSTVYTAVLNAEGLMRILIDRTVVLPIGTKLSWDVPDSTTKVELQIDGEDRTDVGDDFRSFTVSRVDNQPLTTADTGGATDGELVDSIIYFVVKRRPERGSTAILTAADDHEGYYLVEKSTDDGLWLTKEGHRLSIKAETGDVEGLVYERNTGATNIVVKVLGGSLIERGVTSGDYFVTTGPSWSYGQITGISAQPDGSELMHVSQPVQALPETGSGSFEAVTSWAVSPAFACSIELQIPGCNYELTLAFTSRRWSTRWIDLDFIAEEGSSNGQPQVIDSMRFTSVRSFPVGDPNRSLPFRRHIYKLVIDRPQPIPGLPRLTFTKPPGGGEIELAHVVLYRGDLTGVAYNETADPEVFDELEYSASPDGGALPKGTVLPFIGGTCCPPGWKEVEGIPSDGPTTDPPGFVEYEFKDALGAWDFSYDKIEYDTARDVTKLTFDNVDLSKDGFSYYPWSAAKVYMPIAMRPPPNPPVYRFRIKIDRIRKTIFRKRLPRPPNRDQRYDWVEVGTLKPKFGPTLMLQIIPNAKTASFEPREYPYKPDAMYNIMLGQTQVMTEFIAYEIGSSEDPDNPVVPYPSSYNSLYTEIEFITPSPSAIIVLIKAIQNIIDNVRRILLYDPRRTGEPLPGVAAKPVIRTGNTEPIQTSSIELLGDWRQAFTYMPNCKARIVRTGYVKADPEQPGFTDLGADEHNHRVKGGALPMIDGAYAKITGMPDPPDPARPPVCVRHGHSYLGAGGYSRPFARGVKLCVKL